MRSSRKQELAASELRQRFLAGNYINRIHAGEFNCCVRKVCDAQSRDEPIGTTSWVIAGYADEGHRVFLAHFYWRPNGQIGASGQPDPKWLYENGVIYWTP